jgi:hypothetical protein
VRLVLASVVLAHHRGRLEHTEGTI